jgi:hypothetical protein
VKRCAARRARNAALALLVAAAASTTLAATSSRYCLPEAQPNAEQQDQLLRVAAVIKTELERSGATLALVARSGLNLQRVGQRYSHAGLSLRASPETPWAVRQLYYACDESRPMIFDQGLTAFLMGSDDPRRGFVSLLLLPAAAAGSLERSALDKTLALALLGGQYSANAHAYSLQYQNCNQWVAELLAVAWGGLVVDRERPLRAAAQQWLHEQAYAPTVIELGRGPLRWAAALVPWLHEDDHPAEDRAAGRYRLSMPASLQAFALQREPQAQRLEFCHTPQHVVWRRNGAPLPDDCTPAEGDEVVSLAD